MQTTISRLTAKLIESSWLAALVLVPIFFNPHSERIFDEEKVLLLRSIAVVVVVGLAIWIIEKGRGAFTVGGRPVWRVPLVVPALLITGAWTLSTVCSVSPHISFWGAHLRTQGLYTLAAYITIFAAMIFLVRQRAQVQRAVTAVLLASVPATIYAVVQHFGGDPIRWTSDVSDRVLGTAGNPIFISAYLIMVVPLTLVQVIEQCARLLEPPAAEAPRSRLPIALLVVAYLVLLWLQVISIIYSQSRGPEIGLGVGLILFFAVLAVQYRLRWLVLAVTGGTLGAALFLIVFNLPHSPLGPLRQIHYVGRFGNILGAPDGSTRVRTLIWQGATGLLADRPVRDLVGYGPDTMYLVYSRFYPPKLGHFESRDSSPDRAHNESFDALIMTGLFGFLAELSVFLSFFYYVLRWLGIINTATERTAYAGAVIIGGLVGGLAPYFIEGGFRYSGVGLPAGIGVALMAYLIVFANTRGRQATNVARRDGLLLAGLLAAVAAHFVEVHFGIALAATRLYFWTYAALAVAVGVPLVRNEPAADGATDGRHPVLTGDLLGLSPIVGLSLIAVTFGFYSPSVDLTAKGFMVLWVFCGVWLLGALIIIAESATEPGAYGRWTGRLGAYATNSIGLWLLFLAVYKWWLDWRATSSSLSPELVHAIGSYQAHTVTIFYIFVGVAIVFTTAIAFLRERELSAADSWRPVWRTVAYAVLLLTAVPILVRTNLASSQADGFAKLASFFERKKEWNAAQETYAEALRLQPGDEHYLVNLTRVLLAKAGATPPEARQEREALLVEALELTERARRSAPLNTDHLRNRAKVHRMWAGLVDDPAERARHFDEAVAAYTHAVELSPYNAGLWNEWATLYVDRGAPRDALPKLDQSLVIDGRYTTTWWLRANIHVALDELEQAVADYDRALAIDPRLLAAWSGKAMALTRLQRYDDAIAANQSALAVSPADLISHRNLAVLYQQTGRLDLAKAEAHSALAVAKPDERPALEHFIGELDGRPAENAPQDGGAAGR